MSSFLIKFYTTGSHKMLHSNFIFFTSAYAGRWPSLYLTLWLSHQQWTHQNELARRPDGIVTLRYISALGGFEHPDQTPTGWTKSRTCVRQKCTGRVYWQGTEANEDI